MAISENDLKHVDRVRRGRKLIVPVLVLLWFLGGAVWIFRISVLADAGREHGIDGYSELLSEAMNFDEDRPEFSRWEVFLMHQGQSMRTTAYFLVAATVFLISLMPVLGLVDTLAKEVEGSAPRQGS